MKKGSFSLSSSKPSNSTSPSSSNHHQPTNKEFITDFNPSKTLTSQNPIIIPPIPNQWNPQIPQSTIHVTQQFNHINIIQTETETKTDPTSSAIDRLMLMKLKHDLETLPDEPGFGEFDDVPVEEYARAYLKGYGWYEGRGIGKNAKEDVKVVEVKHRTTGREGLGFVRRTTDELSKRCVDNGGN